MRHTMVLFLVKAGGRRRGTEGERERGRERDREREGERNPS